MNQGLITAGSTVNFMHFVQDTYETTTLPLLASTTQTRYQGLVAKYLEPVFGNSLLRDLTPASLQGYFSSLHRKGIGHTTIVKLRDALSSILRCAVKYEFLSRNPLDSLRLPPDKRGEVAKPWISPTQFNSLINLIPEPYATMVCVAIFAGLRVSEVAGLRWPWVFSDSIQVAQRFTRGDWSRAKTSASAKPIAS